MISQQKINDEKSKIYTIAAWEWLFNNPNFLHNGGKINNADGWTVLSGTLGSSDITATTWFLKDGSSLPIGTFYVIIASWQQDNPPEQVSGPMGEYTLTLIVSDEGRSMQCNMGDIIYMDTKKKVQKYMAKNKMEKAGILGLSQLLISGIPL